MMKQEFDTITECIVCGQKKPCRLDVVMFEGKQMIIGFCKECSDRKIEGA